MSDKTEKLNITPDTKVGHLLKEYPDLKEVLFDISPAFKKLSNPLLLKTVAKVTTLRQAAQVGKVSLPEIINRLRTEAGLNKMDISEEEAGYSIKKPEWFITENVIQSLDARPLIERGEHPVGEVLKAVKVLPSGKIFELITPFVPAPLIDKINQTEVAIYLDETEQELIKTYFFKKKL